MDTREEVLRLLQEGVKPAEIAARLGISRQAVYKHIKALRAAGRLPESTPVPAKTNEPVVNRRRRGGQPGNKNAVVTGEYETIWDAGLSDRERQVLREAYTLPVLEHINRQLGLLDIRIGRALERIRQTREALALGIELQLESRSETDGQMGPMDINTTTTRLVHTREILERQEKALDRMLQRRERLLALRAQVEMHILGGKLGGTGPGQGDGSGQPQLVVEFVAPD